MIRPFGTPRSCTAFLLSALAAVLLLVLSAQIVCAAAGAPAPPAKITVLRAGAEGRAMTLSIVLLADTKESRVRGLQGFRALLPGEAALFTFDPPQEVSFWMASLTYAIDIIYIDAAGSVTEVYPRCRPESREIFSSARPVRWVVETAEGSGIRPGDRVRFH